MAGLTQTLPSEPLKLSMGELSAIIGMLSAMDWNAVRNGLESLSAINWNPCPQSQESAQSGVRKYADLYMVP